MPLCLSANSPDQTNKTLGNCQPKEPGQTHTAEVGTGPQEKPWKQLGPCPAGSQKISIHTRSPCTGKIKQIQIKKKKRLLILF